MKKEWFFDRYCGEQFFALLEDGILTDFSAEKEGAETLVGSIFKGRVVNVISGMNAAFVACGLEKNCYLSMEEFYTDYSKYDGSVSALKGDFSDLKVGDEVLVQVTKPPRGNKGAKVTIYLENAVETALTGCRFETAAMQKALVAVLQDETICNDLCQMLAQQAL